MVEPAQHAVFDVMIDGKRDRVAAIPWVILSLFRGPDGAKRGRR
jgi:hypothetical protein